MIDSLAQSAKRMLYHLLELGYNDLSIACAGLIYGLF